MKGNIKHIFFDLDHTLWHFDANAASAYQEVFETLGMPIDSTAFWRAYRPLNLKLWEAYRKDEITIETLRRERLLQTFSAINWDCEPERITEIADLFIDFLPRYNTLLDGAIEVLEYLQPNYRLHVITNGFRKVQQQKLTNSGLLPYFTTVTDSECSGYKKPHPQIFEFALNAAGAKQSESLMIGDCIEADVRGAMQYGMEAFWYCPQGQEGAPAWAPAIKHLTELKNYL